MKRLILLSALCAITVSLSAFNYCAPSSWGYAGSNVTGGGDASVTIVNNVSQLASALNKNSNKVVVITQDLTFTSMVTIQDASNLTIMALPGVKLISDKQNKNESGILFFKRTDNLILRNLTFVGPGAYDIDGNDNLCFEDVTNAWVDHCDFQDGMDGNFDIKSLSDNITVSWCRFRYLKAPRARECDLSDDACKKLTDDHRFSNLIGSSSSQKPADGTYNITYAFCWWDQGCKQRMTRCRNCELHFLNCYWNSSVADYYVGPENAKCYFEGCTFAGKANTAKDIWNPFSGSTNYCTFINCTGNLPASSSTPVNTPTYSYDALSAATAKNYVTNTSCGAGATLSLTESGEVSSSCDGGDMPPIGPVGPVSGDCCINLGLAEEPTTANGGIPAEFQNIVITTNFTHNSSGWKNGHLNLGSNNDFISFDFSAYETTIQSVSFDVTIPGWADTKNTVAYHWNNETNTKYNISSPEKEVVQLTAPAKAKSFTIQRSASTGTQISQVCFELVSSATGIENIGTKDMRCTKVLRNGQFLILRDGKTYSIIGTRAE